MRPRVERAGDTWRVYLGDSTTAVAVYATEQRANEYADQINQQRESREESARMNTFAGWR
jgi:hypothetical protein